jgi:branched-chain amino acid transport system substrate-binding protein
MSKRKSLAVVAVLGALMLTAAACSSNKTTGGGGGGGADKCASDQFGCATYKSGEPIKIGTLLSITGDTAFLGTDSVHGAQLAIDHLDGNFDGKGGQLVGHDVTLSQEDDGCSKDGGQAGGTKLAADPTILAVIGTSCSSSALGVADKILSDKGILLISPSNTNPNLTSEGTHQPFYLRTAYNDKIQGAIVADFTIKMLNAKTAATIHDESPYADALAAVFRDDFTKQGGTVTPNGNQAIQSSDKDFSSLLTTIGQDKPDVLYFPDFDPACALIAKQAKNTPGLENTKLIGSDGCLEKAFIDTGGTDVNGTYVSGPDLSSFQQNDFYVKQFLPAYQAQFGGKPTAAYHAQSYDAMNILFDAIKKVAISNSDGSVQIPRTALKDAIYATSNYQGITGTINCTPLGDCAGSTTVGVYQAPALPCCADNAKPLFSETKTLQEVGG